MKTLSLKVTETLNERLEELARETRCSKSMVIRMAIEEYQRRGRRTDQKSFLARARDLAGSVEGPPDLSTSRKQYHLATLGRGVRGKYLRRATMGTNLVLIDPDLVRVFPTGQAVNDALRVFAHVASAKLQARKRSQKAV